VATRGLVYRLLRADASWDAGTENKQGKLRTATEKVVGRSDEGTQAEEGKMGP
jgi:hypothetical protein